MNKIVNTRLLVHPLNWFIVLSVALVALFFYAHVAELHTNQ